MTSFSIAYNPEAGRKCQCGNGDIGCVFGELEGEPRCLDCLDRAGWSEFARLVEALDQVDSALYFSQETAHGPMLSDAVRILFAMEEARSEGGRDDKLPDRVMADEIVRRRPESMTQEDLFQVLAALVPKANRTDLAWLTKAAEFRHALYTAQAVDVGVAGLILTAAGATEGSSMTVIEAVEQLGIDYLQFSGAVIAAAAAAGVDVESLPGDVINSCLATALKTEETQ